MFESFITSFIIYFVVIDPVGNAPFFLAVRQHLDRARKLRTTLEGTAIASAIILFFALCGGWILAYLNVSEAAFHIGGGIILFLVALDMLAAKHQQRKREATTTDDSAAKPDNVAIYPLRHPASCRPVSYHVGDCGYRRLCQRRDECRSEGYATLLAVMVATCAILILTVLAEGWMNEKITMAFSRITAIILAGLSLQYIIDGLTAIGLITT